MATLHDGASVVVEGSGANDYRLEHKGDVYSCTCPAWRNQAVRIEQRTCKHLRAYLGDASETARVGVVQTTPRAPRDGIKARRVTHYVEDRDLRAERLAALDRAVARAPVLDDRMQTVYGLRLPRHLAYAMGFWMGLTAAERKEAWSYLGNGPIGVGAWFLDGAHERRVKAGLDERLDYRYRRDPPELVSVFSGSSDGCHWGLWYDDPNELPLGIVVNHARDSAETLTCEETLLATLQANVEGRRYAFEEPFNPTEWPRRTAILQWLELVLARELDVADHQRKRDTRKPPNLIGGVGSVDPKWALPAELDGKVEQEARLAAYRRRDPIVNDWIALAQKELAAGSAGRALHYGRELHWIDADEWRAECTELLIGAYKQLDRLALAEIVRVHHAHRDLASVSVFEAVDSGSTARTTDEVDFETADLLESLRDAGGDLAPEFAEHVRVQVIASFTRHGARRSSLRCCARLGSR